MRLLQLCAMKKTRFLSLALCALNIILVLAMPFAPNSSAAPPENESLSGTAIPVSDYTSLSFLTRDSEWNISGTAEYSVSDDGTSVTLTGISGSVSAGFSGDEVPVDGMREVGFTVRTYGASKCTYSIEAQFGEVFVRTSAESAAGGEICVFVQVPDGAYYLTAMTVRLTLVGSRSDLASATVRAVAASPDDHLGNIRKYSAVRLRVTDQTYVGERIISIAANREKYAARLHISAKNGAVTFSVSQNGKDFTVIGSSVLGENRSEYLFSVSGFRAPTAYKVEFTGSGDVPVLEGVDFIALTSDTTSIGNELGKITKCAVSDDWKTLSVSGTLTRDATIQYIDAELCLFGVKMWESRDNVMKSEPIARLKMSTSFTFTVDSPGDALLFSSYFVAVRSDDYYIIATDQEYPSYPTVRSQIPALSAYGITPAEAFSSGFDGYIIDIDAGAMFEPNANFNSGILTIDNSYYYLNSELVTEIDRTVEFLSKAGISAILRLDVSAPKFGSCSELACKSIAAAVSFLADRYSPAAIILRSVVDTSAYSARIAGNTANMLRLAYAAASRNSAEVPGGLGSAVIAEIPTDTDESPETMIWLLSRGISEVTKAPIRMIFTGIEPTASAVARARALAAISESGSSAEFTLCFKVTGDRISEAAELIAGSALKNAVLSIGDGTASPLESDSYEDVRAATFGSVGDGIMLWDFTRAYNSAGFSGSGGNSFLTAESRLMEEYTGIPACRALTANLADVSDVILAQPSSPLNLSGMSRVGFLIAAECDAPFSLDIIFISGKTRTLFTASFDGGGVFSPICDLSSLECAKKVDRIAIVLREGANVRLGIAQITAAGGTASIDDLYVTEMTAKPAEPGRDAPRVTADPAVLAIVGVAVLTIVVFALLSRHHEE